MKNLPIESDLISELKLTFQGLHVRPVSEFGNDFQNCIGVWTGGPGDMPDGLPIFNSLGYSEAEYTGSVHVGFEKWLEDRGWYTENYDGATHLIFPIQYARDVLDEYAKWYERPITENTDVCPF